jgi:hypothetical protein
MHGEKTKAYRNLVGKPQGRPKCRWINNIKMDLREIKWGGMDCTNWLRIGTSGGYCEHGNGPSGSIKSWEVLELLHNWQLLKKGSAPGS